MNDRATDSFKSRSFSQQGMALIAVLLLLVFVLTIVGGLFYRHQIHIQKVTRILIGEQALLLLMSAESWAQSVLLEDAKNSSSDHWGEIWARQLPVLPVEGGYLSGCLRDLQGGFNLNSLSWYTNKRWEDEILAEGLSELKTTRRTFLRDLLIQLELDGSDHRIASLVDWVDTDSQVLSPQSAEDNEYLLLDPPYRAANHSLVDLSELSLVQGFSTIDVARLQPYVNTIAEEVAVNVNTVSEAVLVALSPLITSDIAKIVISARPFEALDEFYLSLANIVNETQQNLAIAIPADLLSIKSDYFTLLADIDLAGVRVTYHSVIYRNGDGSSGVISRSLRHIPPLKNAQGEALAVNTICNQMQEAPVAR